MADVRLTATNPEDSSVVPVACDASGRLLLQEMPAFDGTVDGDLTVSGKGSFAGGKSIIGNDGSAQFAQGAVDIYASGTTVFTQNVTFAGAVIVGDPTSAQKGVISDPAGVVLSYRPPSEANTEVFAGVWGGSNLPNQITSSIFADGKATFAGDVRAPEFDSYISGIDASGVKSGTVNFGVADTNSSTDITHARIQSVGAGSSGPGGHGGNLRFFTKREYASGGSLQETLRLTYEGDAVFAGGKAGFTSEGYLWCTTRRGDTVILDATSNGLASWVEYTGARIDRIRDELNAIREDASEMPADTP